MISFLCVQMLLLASSKLICRVVLCFEDSCISETGISHGNMWHFLLTIEFSTGAYECVNISLLCFPGVASRCGSFILVGSVWWFLVCALYGWLSLNSCLPREQMTVQHFLALPGDGKKPKTTSEMNHPPPKHFFLSSSSS